MNKVRIGNNVNVRWKVYNSNGSLYPIIGKIVGLYVSSASLEKVIDTYEIESRNELSFSLLAGELTRYGTYKLVLRLREGDSETEDATYDLVQMFQIVSKSYPERPNILDGEVNIEFSSVLNNLIVDRVEGMSAYEVAVAQGFTGTVSEWLASLQGEPGNDGSFWATYGTTKSVEIAAAIESGRSVFCNWNSLIYRLDKISFSQSSIYTFHVNSDAYQNSLTCQDDVWSHDEVKMATDAQVDEKTSVFFATYNSTTWQEINEAVTAGDAVFLKKDEDIYPLVGDGGVTPKLWEFAFVDTSLDHHRAVCHNDDTWQSGIRGLASVIDLASKQDVISDLAAIRAGAALGSTAYQKPSTGIPASDIASGVIPDISGKQDTLVSGSNIKTINGSSILGSGDIQVQTEITMDNVPTSGSNNPVKSGGLYTELAEKIGSQDIDNVVELTLAQFNALATKDARTMYIISDSTIASDHVGVASLVQTTTSTEDGGTNVWTCTLTNGQSFTLEVKNGNQGNSGYSGAAGELEVVNNVTQGGATAALSAEMGKQLEGEISQLGQEVGDLDSTLSEYEDKVRLSNTDTLYVVDGNGNIIAKIDADGVTSVDFIDANGKKFSQLSSILSAISSKFDDAVYIADSDGNVVAKIDKDGVQAVNFLDKNGNPFGGNLIGYQLFSLGDSLSAGGKWQAKVAALTGAEFDQAKNIDGQLALSVGGTITGGDGFDNGLWRAKHLIDGGYITDDGEKSVVILECVNDISVVGTSGTFDKTAPTIVPTDPIEGYEYANWGAALLASIPSAQRKMNACFRLLITGQSGKNLAVSTMPSSEGDVTLRITTSGAGTKDYSLHILPTDSLQDILGKILEINYTSVTDTLAANGTSVDFVGVGLSVSFIDTDSTGMAVSITNTSSASSSTAMYFVGDSVADWEDTTKWIRGTALTFSMAYKSVIEMLLKEYPKLHLFMGMFPALSDDPDTYALPNGNFDTYAFYNTTRMQQNRNLQSVLADIAGAYRIPFVDVFGLCGIGITNYSEFYYDNNVHPKDVGYERFGEVVAAFLCDRIV